MVERYFEKFPITSYSNTNVVDITKRSTLLNLVYNNPYAFYPYEITSNERADQLSYRYYDDQYKSWILYFSNRIVDPYYEWYLHDSEFNAFIISKYGSFENSVEKIKYYLNNWVGQENIAPNYYNALPPNLKKYWEPVYNNYSIISYKRSEYDWIVNTNKIVSYNTYTSNTVTTFNPNFIKDEICKVYFTDATAQGQLLSFSNTSLQLQHVSGEYVYYNSGYIVGTESGSNVTFNTASLVIKNIPDEELIYWSPVTYYEYEMKKNEYNKTLRVIDKVYTQKLSDNLKTTMNE